ncbi:hypothetical protein BDQ12DRAFT_715821 [Crucibulum laeve]|uniref:DUF6533 domain-containing protein n=1 Tax=Crucibulum laeve TaxID=68775 RepID=A0A5C3LJY3_9AGAR|nr:hypothetical protein BDQ12DRAFT_715821 [Crucibulum laeve]
MLSTQDSLRVLYEHALVTRYINVASIAILIFDWCLTFELECSLIWSAKWNIVKALFLITRYLPFFDAIIIFYHQFAPLRDTESCQIAYRINAWLFVVGAFTAEAMLSLRTWAVWKKSRHLAVGLSLLLASVCVAASVSLSFFLKTILFTIPSYPLFTGCLCNGGSSLISVVWIMLMVYDVANLILMSIQAVKLKSRKSIYFGCEIVAMPLTMTVYQEGIIYYLYLFGMFLYSTPIHLQKFNSCLASSLLNVVLTKTLSSDFVNLLAMFKAQRTPVCGSGGFACIRGYSMGEVDQRPPQ